MTKLREPILGVSHTPMDPLKPSDMHVVARDVPIETLAPRAQGLLICRCNGEFLARESWASTTRYGDVIEFYDVPQDKDMLRVALTIAVMVVLGPGGVAGLTGWQATIAVIAATIAINVLLPPTMQEDNRQKSKDVFSASLSGNQARLDEPIWKICGRREINPPFACQPYMEFRPRPEGDVNLDNDQYYMSLFAIGVGNYEVFAKIGNTAISRFADVKRAEYLAPSVLPATSDVNTTVLANVTTATEVTSQVLESAKYVGGFSACAPGRTCDFIGIDIAATKGLGRGEDSLTVAWQVEYRAINDFGQVIGDGEWAFLHPLPETRTGRTPTPQRWSFKYAVPGAPLRVEIRIVRTDQEDKDNPGALHQIAWTGLRAYLHEAAPLNQYTSHYAVVMRASEQLSNATSQDFRLIVKAKCRTLNAELEWQAETHTRNPAWWILDLATSDTWGIDKPDDRVDLQSFYDLALVCDARQDRCDYVFDKSVNAWDAMQLIARTARSRVFRRNGVISVARDELAELPVTAFTPRNCQPGMSISEVLRQRNSPDGIVIEYQDHRTWEWTPIAVNCPGHPDVATNPIIKRIEGITGATHAHREALYEAANMMYRTRTVGFKTEMQGLLPAYMSTVDFLPDIVGYGHSGDVAFWNAGTLVMGLTEPADFSAGPLYLTLIRDDGTLTDPALVLPGATEYDIILPAAPDFTLVVDDGTRERPKYLLGVKDTVKIAAINDGGQSEGGAQLYAMAGVIDDDRVHTADIALLPGPGVVQDPTGEPDDVLGGGGIRLLAFIDDLTIGNQGSEGVSITYTFYLNNNGSAAHDFGGYQTLAGQWLIGWPAETSTTGLMEVRLTLLSGYLMAVSSATGVWLPLDVTRSFTASNQPTESWPGAWLPYANVLVEIRVASSGIIQDSGTISIICT